MMTPNLKIFWVGLVSISFLTACASVPLTSMPKLAGINPETIDISQVEMAVRVNDDYRVVKNTANLKVMFKNKKTGKVFKKKIIFPETMAPLTKYLRKQKKPGFNIYRYKLDANATETANEFRENVLKFKAKNKGDNNMTLSASALFCSVHDNNTYADVMMKFYVKTKPKQEFYTLFKQQKMAFKDKEGKRVKLPLCTVENSYWGK